MNLDDRIRDGLSRALDAARLPEGDAALAMGRGVALRKRKNRRSVALVAASVVLILGAGVGLQQVAAGDGDDRREPTPTDQVPEAPDGMRLVGMGRVVVAVPEEWHANPNYSCSPDKADADTATLRIQRDKPQGRPLFCLTLGVSFFALDSPKGQAVSVSKMVPDVINGLDVIRSPDRPCHLNVTRHCPETVVVPSENVIMEFTTVDAAGFDHIIDTLRLLPDGFTTVPLIARRTPLAEATAVIEGAGLRVNAGSAPKVASVLATEPAAGSVMPAGGVVGLSVEATTCGTGPQESPPPCEPEDPVLRLPEGEAWPEALVTGVLTMREGCLFVGGRAAVWPHESTWDEALRTVSVGSVTLRLGDQVSGSGGYYPVGDAGGAWMGEQLWIAAEQCASEGGAESVVLVRPEAPRQG